MFALSLKQPWAALLAHGLKTVEVRQWQTAFRGRILIHAARMPDDRPEAWALVPPDLEAAARRVGGVVGAGDLVACFDYPSAEEFARDQARHLNDPSWFRPPVLYGFSFKGLSVLPFSACRGRTGFFRVNAAQEKARSGGRDLFGGR